LILTEAVRVQYISESVCPVKSSHPFLHNPPQKVSPTGGGWLLILYSPSLSHISLNQDRGCRGPEAHRYRDTRHFGQGVIPRVVESAHRQHDEASLMVHAERCEHTLAFLERAQRWQDTWNYLRPHFGEGMEGKPPTEKPKSSSPPVP